jgi:hypothetical protein
VAILVQQGPGVKHDGWLGRAGQTEIREALLHHGGILELAD